MYFLRTCKLVAVHPGAIRVKFVGGVNSNVLRGNHSVWVMSTRVSSACL
jgi:hypothetical protein